MSRRGHTDSEALLGSLLDHLEAKPDVARHRAYVDFDGFKSIAEQDRLIRELEAVAREGGIEIRRRRVDGAEIIAHVVLKDAALLYRHLDRVPATIGIADALAPIRSRADLPPTFRAVFDMLAAAWCRGVSSLGLRPGEVEGLTEALDLVLALDRRRSGAEVTLLDYRTFSRNAGVRSKALEQRAATVVALLSRLIPDAAEQGLDAAEILATFGVTRLPQPLLVSGPLTLDDAPLADLDYWGVPAESANRLGLGRPVSYMLAVENYASFVRHVREINSGREGLIIYTGGFPARPILTQLVRLAQLVNAPVFHWGDIDPGGLRIFRHLEEALSQSGIALAPHMMTRDLVLEHGAPIVSKRNLTRGSYPESAISDLWDVVATSSLAVEQESFAPADPLGADGAAINTNTL